MSQTSSVDAVTAGLVALLADAALPGGGGPLDGVQVSDGSPVRGFDRESIYTYGASNWTQVRDDFDGDRSESYTIDLAIRVLRPGDSGAAARARAFELLAAIEDVVRDQPSIADGSIDDQILPKEHGVSPDTEGFLAVILAGVRVEAFI